MVRWLEPPMPLRSREPSTASKQTRAPSPGETSPVAAHDHYREPVSCQTGVFVAYASSGERALADRKLYLPRSCTAEADRHRAAKVPDSRGFATKGEMARAMILRALASPLPVARATGDCAYGQEWPMHRTLEEAGVGSVLAVLKSQQLDASFGRIGQAIAGAPDEAWERRSCGNGARRPAYLRLGSSPSAGDRCL